MHGSIFGSAARADGNSQSDIDLLVVRPSGVDAEDPIWRRQLDDLATAVLNWTGNDAGVVELPEQDLSKLRRRRPPVLANLDADAITLSGIDIESILRREM